VVRESGAYLGFSDLVAITGGEGKSFIDDLQREKCATAVFTETFNIIRGLLSKKGHSRQKPVILFVISLHFAYLAFPQRVSCCNLYLLAPYTQLETSLTVNELIAGISFTSDFKGQLLLQ
jgi:hypothetical protein